MLCKRCGCREKLDASDSDQPDIRFAHPISESRANIIRHTKGKESCNG